MDFDLKNLELFVRAATLGAIGRAGAELGYSATNTSHRIQTLEDSLKAKLFHRTTRAISLTPDGEMLLAHAKRILEAVEDAQSALAQDSVAISGTLRVTASTSFARHHVIPFIPAFMEQHPNLHLDLHLSDNVVDIVELGFDVAFRIGELASSSLMARKIADNPALLVASPDYLARYGTPKTTDDLKTHVCMGFGRGQTWIFRAPDGQSVTVPTSSRISVNLGDALGEWVLAGMGIGRAALWHVGPDLRAGRLVQVLPDYRAEPQTSIWAVRPPGAVMPRRVQIFIDYIQTCIRETNVSRYGGLL